MQTLTPWGLIHQELTARGWSDHDLAAAMGRPVAVVRELLVGQRNITPDLARRLSVSVGMSAATWLDLDRRAREPAGR